jgi:hypothetical protein
MAIMALQHAKVAMFTVDIEYLLVIILEQPAQLALMQQIQDYMKPALPTKLA